MLLQIPRWYVHGAVLLVGVGLGGAQPTFAQPAAETAESLREGRSFIPTKVYTAEQDQELLELMRQYGPEDVAGACCPRPLDLELRDVLRRQAEWTAASP